MDKPKDKIHQPLKNVFIAIEPPVYESALSPSKHISTIRKFQDAMVLPQGSIVSMIHSSMYMVPMSWYYDNENGYAAEAKSLVDGICKNKLFYDSVRVLKAKASANHFLVDQISEFLVKTQSDLLVVLASNRKGVPYWLLGSFAETAALTCRKSVMVIKSQSASEFSSQPRLTVALDADASYSSKDIDWLLKLSVPGNVHLDLVFVRPKPHKVLSKLRKANQPRKAEKNLKKIEQTLQGFGATVSFTILKESNSIPETIIDFSNKKKSWGIVTISTERSLARKLLLGSTARKILMLTTKPFISIRTH